MNVAAWVSALRLRTLPLSSCGTIAAALCLLNVPLTLQIKERKEADKLIKVLSFSTLVMVVVFSVVLNV